MTSSAVPKLEWVASDRPEPADLLLSATLATEAALKLSGPESVHPDALRSYAVHYLTATSTPAVREDGSRHEGSFKSFFRQSRAHPTLVRAAAEGLKLLAAEASLTALRRGERIARQLDAATLETYFLERGPGWQHIVGAVNGELKKVRFPNEDLVDRNARWIGRHEALRRLSGAAYRRLCQERRAALGTRPSAMPWVGFHGI